MARLTSGRPSGRVMRGHSLSKLAGMHIFVAGRAANLAEVIGSYLLSSGWLVTLDARNSNMTSVQLKIGLLVHRHRVASHFEGGPIVALLALILPRCPRKLAFVLILVAIDAECIFHLEARVFSRRNMAGRAWHFGMGKGKCKSRFPVISHREDRWRPSLHCMTALTLSSVGAFRELPAVRIRLMTICTELMRNWALEISACVTIQAANLLMLALEGKLRFRMVECRSEGRLLPREGRVA